MKIKRFIAIIILIVLLFSYMLFAMRDFTVFAADLFWDLKAFIMVMLIPTLVSLITFTPKDIASYISVALNKNEKDIEKLTGAKNYFNKLLEITICTGILIFFFSLMVLLSDLSVSAIGKNSGTGLCAIIYTFIIVVLFILPVRNTLVENLVLAEKTKKNSWTDEVLDRNVSLAYILVFSFAEKIIW